MAATRLQLSVTLVVAAVVEPVDDPPEEETAMDIPVQPAPAEDHSWGGGNRMDTEEHVSDGK